MLASKYINRGKNIDDLDFKKILIIRLDEIGDVCYTLFTFDLLKKKYPLAEITVWCSKTTAALFEDHPSVARVVKSVEELDQKFDLIVEQRGNFESISFSLKNKPLYRVDRGAIKFRNSTKGVVLHERDVNLQVIEPLIKNIPLSFDNKIFVNDEVKKTATDFLAENSISKFCILHTGARAVLRRWPEEKFAALASYIKNELHLDIVFCGDKSDMESVERISRQIPFKTFSVAGKFSLKAFAALCHHTSLFIGNESGPLHIASTQNVPCVGLFGPGQITAFYPLGESSKYVHHVLPCNPCKQVTCVHQGNTCMMRITLDEVKQKISELRF